jgi:hypothetical protein
MVRKVDIIHNTPGKAILVMVVGILQEGHYVS